MLSELVFLLLANAAMSTSEPLFEDEEKSRYNFGLGKRAYSYVSEYKRLPVYNFGLGKRSDKTYQYDSSKQTDNDESKYDRYSVVQKRGKNYNFGLGKRLPPNEYNFGLGKKATPQYSFGLGKRLGHYNFGLGKRQGKYSFGLGKKDKAYSFGLGKRYTYIPADDDDEIDYEDTLDEEKRAQKYAFGLGKRYAIFDDDEPDNQSESRMRYTFDLDKSNTNLELPIKAFSQSETKQITPSDKKYEQ